MQQSPKHLETLDPEDWDELRQTAHQMVDDALDYLIQLPEQSVWQPVPEEIKPVFNEPAPLAGEKLGTVYQEFKQTIMPYGMGNTHPRFWGWYMGNGTIGGALGDFLAAVMNPNVGGGNHVANDVERQVVNWMKQLMEFPSEASGLLVSGGSMANFIGLAVARNAGAGYDVRQQGIDSAGPRLLFYASEEVHSSNQKAIELLGLGHRNLRLLPVDEQYRLDLGALQAAIEQDRNAGHKPVCVIATPGTINTGAIDDLDAIADICTQQNLWFHVDGAIGAVAMLSQRIRPLLKGIQRADSVAMDLHKWMHIPFEAGCVLVRHEQAHIDTFTLTPEYLQHDERGLAAGKTWFSDYGLQLSRQFRALKIWMSIKEHGLDKFGRMMDRNIEQAAYLAQCIEQEPKLELMAPAGLDIVCFRYNPGQLNRAALNSLNNTILVELHERGIAVPSYTTLNGRYCLRVAIANHRSSQEDFDWLIQQTLALGSELLDVD